MINKDTIDELNKLGFGADIDSLESYIESLQEAASLGKPIVTDTVYDQHIRLLEKLKPESEILKRNWEVDDFDLDEHDKLLEQYGMRSITTIQNMQELNKFKSQIDDLYIDMVATVKLNGHAIRAVYKNGKLVGGSTRGRYKKGRDITRHLKAVLPNYIDKWSDKGLVEVRGEMLVSLDTFETYLKNTLKTPLSSVTSLIRESATEDDISMLNCVCFKILSENDLGFENKWEELQLLNECGFETPQALFISGVDYYNIDHKMEQCIAYFENLYYQGDISYSSDGIVVTVNDNDIFEELGLDGNSYVGNFALKMGKVWESNIYSSIIEDIEFIYGKSYITPKARIKPVITVTGAEVNVVPLYNVGVIERYELFIGREIHFKFGGETGVTLVQPDGTSVAMSQQ